MSYYEVAKIRAKIELLFPASNSDFGTAVCKDVPCALRHLIG